MFLLRNLFLTLTLITTSPLLVNGNTAFNQKTKGRLCQLNSIKEATLNAIRKGALPGAVILVGHQGNVVYKNAFGNQSIFPFKQPMQGNTIFDLASLTKVIATTSSIMKLIEEGRIGLNDKISNYFPEIYGREKNNISIRDLMTHYSGLKPGLDLSIPWFGQRQAIRLILQGRVISPSGSKFIYSDNNFSLLGEIVRRVSGKHLDIFSKEKIFSRMDMKDTFFRPKKKIRWRIAPTQHKKGKTGDILWGVVHDPIAQRMEGLSGHAGLFSTVDDLSIFAQMILDGGRYRGKRIFSPTTINKMTSPQSPPGMEPMRGLGWDNNLIISLNSKRFFSDKSFGHTGHTGTSIWIDPISKTYVIILSNRVHPDGRGDIQPLRRRIASIVVGALS